MKNFVRVQNVLENVNKRPWSPLTLLKYIHPYDHLFSFLKSTPRTMCWKTTVNAQSSKRTSDIIPQRVYLTVIHDCRNIWCKHKSKMSSHLVEYSKNKNMSETGRGLIKLMKRKVWFSFSCFLRSSIMTCILLLYTTGPLSVVHKLRRSNLTSF